MKIQEQGKLRSHLHRSSETLYTRFKSFELQASSLLEWSQAGAHMFYTTHGLSHIRRVEDAYDWLLSDEDINDLSAAEVFCLLCATYCHDLFMVPRFPGDEGRARRDHATKASSELRKLQTQLGLSTAEATYIGEIIRGHHVENICELMDDTVLGAESIRIRMLGACLSLADICHADESRAPTIVFKYLSIEEDSARHWKRHMQISGVNRSEDNIVLAAISFSEEGKLAIEEYVVEINKQLERVSPFFKSKLLPIVGVKLQLKELESEFDQDLSFRADTVAILDMLVAGIYHKADVFVRELIQNALDATYVEAARRRKNGIPYRPMISVAELRDDEGELIGVRVDDNGSGMDVAEVKDTLLWIGQSRNDKESIQEILKETGKSLIANFGVGLLSCFRVAENIKIRTQKGSSGRPFEITISGYGEKISLTEIEEDICGTSIFVNIKPDFSDMDAEISASHYCRMITLAEIFTYYTSNIFEFDLPRKEIFQLIEDSGPRIGSPTPEDKEILVEGNGYYCKLMVKWNDALESIANSQGNVDILNDGIFVTTMPTEEWLPKSFGFLSGTINFAAKAIDLPVARDAVVQNEKFELRLMDLAAKAPMILSRIIAESRVTELRDKAAILVAYVVKNSKADELESVLPEIGGLVVNLHSGSLLTLQEIRARRPLAVYVNYKDGSWVSELAKLDGVQLYCKKDNLAEMQAELAQRDGCIVVNAVRADRLTLNTALKESVVIEQYLSTANIEVVDLLGETPFLGNLRSLGVPAEVRAVVGRRVKFVETMIQPDKVGWDFGSEVWLNLTNPLVRNIYSLIRGGDMSSQQKLALEVIVNLVDNEFDYILNTCMDALT